MHHLQWKIGQMLGKLRVLRPVGPCQDGAQIYPLMEMKEMQKRGIEASKTPINRYSIVTSGRGLPSKEVERVADALGTLAHEGIDTCASFGILKENDLDLLKGAGVTRYHHNLETSKSHFDRGLHHAYL